MSGYVTKDYRDFRGIRRSLFRDLAEIRGNVDADPRAAVLSLCRIVYSFKRGRIMTSSLMAAAWASKIFPEWSQLIRTSSYQTNGRLLKNGRVPLSEARKFLRFAMVRAVSFDAACDIRRASKTRRSRGTRRINR